MVVIFLDRETLAEDISGYSALDAGSSPWSRTHHDAPPLRSHQDETFGEDRVPGCLPGSPSERLPRVDDPPLEILRRLAEWGRWSRLWPDKHQLD